MDPGGYRTERTCSDGESGRRVYLDVVGTIPSPGVSVIPIALGKYEPTEDGTESARRPVPVSDLHASLWHAFGVDPWTEYLANDRPITLVPKEGRIGTELFA